jgi:hypothetical protein
LLSTGPGEAPSTGPAQHHAQLIRTSSKFNKLRNVFSDREKNFCITSEYRDVSGPGFISLKKYPGLRTHGFLFLTAKAREETRRKDSCQFAGGCCQDENKWGSPGGGRIGQGES